MPQPWPASYAQLKNVISRKWGLTEEILLLREFSDGKSTARVFEVDVKGAMHNGAAILKLDSMLDG